MKKWDLDFTIKEQFANFNKNIISLQELENNIISKVNLYI